MAGRSPDPNDGPKDLDASPMYARLAAAFPIVLWFGWFVLGVHLGRSRPQNPDIQNQLVIPHTEHGATIYLSKSDSILLNMLFSGAIASFGLLLLLDRLARRETLPTGFEWVRDFDGRTFKQSNRQGFVTVAAVVMLIAYLMFY